MKREEFVDQSNGIQRQRRGLNRRKFIESAAVLAGSALLPDGLLAAATARCTADHRTGNRIAATPAFDYRAYRSKVSRSADVESWVQIDLLDQQPIESILLYPANQFKIPHKNAYYCGEGFPVRFKIEASDQADFRRPLMVDDHTGADFDNPKDNILCFRTKGVSARYIRLTVTKFANPLCTDPNPRAPEAHPPRSARGQYWFALSKIGVISNGRDIAVGGVVIADATYGNKKDLGQLTRAERIETEYVRRDQPDLVTDPSTWRPIDYSAQAPHSGVKLCGGIFEQAMRNNIGYLLGSFTADDLLLQFRQRANKPIPPSNHVPHPFWEMELAGSNAGRFLMGAGNTLRWIEHSELRRRFEAVIDGIAECKQANGDIMAYPEDTIFYSERGGYVRSWVTHGLIAAGYAGNQKAFSLLRGYYDWFDRCKYLPDLMRGGMQGGQGMIANTIVYLSPVGKPADIQVLQRYYLEEHWLAALTRMEMDQVWQYPYDRPHCYLLTNLKAYLDLYRATGDERWYDGVKAAWEMYRTHWEQKGGSISIIEYNYSPPDSNSLTQDLGELCGSSFWVFLSQAFQSMQPDDERYATEIEKSIYNVALAHQDGSYGLRYHTVLSGRKEKATRINTCCEGQGTRLIGSLPEHIYSLSADGIYVNMFEPSTISWRHQGEPVGLQIETMFPFDKEVRLTFKAAQLTQMKLRVRVPSWAMRAMEIKVNQASAVKGKPGTFVTIDRAWSNGDTVSFTLPAEFVLREYTGVSQIHGKKRYSLSYGPILYALVGREDAVLRLPKGSQPEDLIGQLSPQGSSQLNFTMPGNPGVYYMPFWQVEQEEFTCFPVIDIT